ncbi:hypothetical protein HMPREF0083_03910 [Aneurinibacillus aneurinilyticus ATCC 12856]|uniref:Uncharacterized protein n=1 Tax=Aneurinibacillus aneurinilyticus ATCC 12856 TaxID=649747 RepID=U1WHG5_ANEAE|nr:hypothetical protein HMPREF0083_03910 [Aneurinibacillus aneurinilyticus ATCC 12856]
MGFPMQLHLSDRKSIHLHLLEPPWLFLIKNKKGDLHGMKGFDFIINTLLDFLPEKK